MNLRHITLAAASAAALMSFGTAGAAPRASAADIQSQYEHERAACLSGRTAQDQATCLKEAGAARNDARRGVLESGIDPNYRANALARCQAFSAADAAECRARVLEPSLVTGSVGGGGLLRERVTIEPVPVPPAAVPAPASAPVYILVPVQP